MRALIVTPAPEGSLTGNRWTALRWAGVLERLQHTATLVEKYDGEPCELMIALHGAKSADSIARFRKDRPRAPLLVALTGTDVYRDIRHSEAARRSLALASRLIALQSLASREIDEALHPKLRVIHQSVEPVDRVDAPADDRFEIAVLAHLRPVKDPLRAARAVRRLPADSRACVLHVGAVLEPEMERRAREEEAGNPRYRWLGPLPRDAALRVLARSRLMVSSSTMEGGANVIGEAAVHGVPILASRIPGSIGLLGEDYPGYFDVGDTGALAALLRSAETDAAFRDELRARCEALAPLFDPERELEAWRALLVELFSA
jgi:putative glycosyltransferase (TIGR04348 family)